MLPPILTISLPSGPSFDMMFVEGGEFLMGSNEDSSEKPIHPVKVSSFYMGKYQVTQALWKAVMNDENPSRFQGDMRPVEQVSWLDTHKFIKKLYKETGKIFQLPTEAEWEYAARGGIYSQGYTYAGSDKLKQVGWYNENSNYETHDVGLLLANELGIHDLSGNVYEWCEDDWHGDYKGTPKDGSAWIDSPERGESRVVRGGYYFSRALYCRPAYRFRLTPDDRFDSLGFRFLLPFQSVGEPLAFP